MRDHAGVNFLRKGELTRKILMVFLLLSGFGLFMAGEALCATITINNGTPQTYSSISISSSGDVSITTGSPPPTTGNTIRGRVTTSYGAVAPITCGVPSVNMACTLTGGTTYNATSDSNGNYTFSNLSDGEYTVAATKTYYNISPPTGSFPVQVAGTTTVTVNFSATSTAAFSISGNVMDKNGRGFSGVTIELWVGSTKLDGADQTGTSGDYTIDGLADGITYTLKPVMGSSAFTQTSQNVTINGTSVTGINFTESSGTCPAAGWVSLNNRIGSTSFYGINDAWAGQGIAFPANQTINLYIDPSVVGLGSVGNMVVGDSAQRISPMPIVLYRLNSDCSVNSSHAVVNFSCSTNQCAPKWLKADPYKAGERLLIKVTPLQTVSDGMAYWAP